MRTSHAIHRSGNRIHAKAPSLPDSAGAPSRATKDTTRDMNPDLSILLVDDGCGDRSLSSRVARDCASAGLRTTTAPSIADALRLHADGGFDLVLLVHDAGFECCVAALERVIGAVGATPVVLLTAHPDDALSARALALGVQDHVVKEAGDRDNASLARSLRTAVLRQRLHVALAAGPLPALSACTTIDGWLGSAPMSATLPHVFHDLVGNVAELLGLASGAESDRVANVIMAHVPTISARLAMVSATPADVAEIVRAASILRTRQAPDKRILAVHCELLLIALLGALCDQYEREGFRAARSPDGTRLGSV